MARDSSRVFGVCGERTASFGWRADTGAFTLGEPSTTSEIVPEHASEDGSTVTGIYHGYPGGLFVWRESRGFELVASSGGTQTMGLGYGLAVSADGSTVLGAVSDDATARLVRWSSSAGVIDLEVPPAQHCQPMRLSRDGRIAAGTCYLDNLGHGYAAIWDSDGRLQRLDDPLHKAGVDLKGTQLSDAKVHANGRFVSGRTSDGQSYVAQLP